MEILLVLLGAALALLGGFITQLVFWRKTVAHSKDVIKSAFRAELRAIRFSLGSSLAGYRDSLRAGHPPTPTVFALPSPVFNANAGNLGQLLDIDLIEHIVDVYSGLQSLSEQALLYETIQNEDISQRDLNSMHMLATTAHISVMKLHNRLTDVPADQEINLDEIEVESRRHFGENAKLVNAGQIHEGFTKNWR